MKGLDLSRLKKISSDDKTTLFRHDSGHEIKIAHGGLSAKIMKELQSIPIDGQKMAKGGQPQMMAEGDDDVSSDDSTKNATPATTSSQPAPIQQTSAGMGQGGAAQDQPQNATDQAGAADVSQDSGDGSDDDQSQAVPAASVSAPQAASLPPTAGQVLSQPVSSDVALAHLNDQTAKLRQDFNDGIITPKSYADLFARHPDTINADGTITPGESRGTLSKLGMIFGLMIGGAGSGLAGQPNALLGMMDKEIDRDLDAQKQSKGNQFSALNLAENHYRNEVANHFTQQQGALTEQNTNLAKVNTDLAAKNLAKTSLELGFEQDAARKAGMIPPNTPAGQRARAGVGVLSNAITQQQAQRNQQTAGQIEMNGQQVQQGQPQAHSGYLLNPNAQNIYRSLQYDPTKTPQQKTDIENQYNQAVQAEKALAQIHELFPKMAATTTVAGSLANATESTLGGLPFGLGELGKLPGEAIRDLGGQKEKLNQSYKTQLMGYIGSALAGTNTTPSEIAKMAEDYFPTESTGPEVQSAKLKGLTDKIVNLTKTSALESAGMTK